MLLVVSAAVSVDQMEVVEANTNPYGLVVVVPNITAGKLPVTGETEGRLVNEMMPAPKPPPLELSVQYNCVEVATREPVHGLPALLKPTQPLIFNTLSHKVVCTVEPSVEYPSVE